MGKKSNIFLSALPVTGCRKQAITGLVVGLSVFLILILFQPFGTFEFQMKYKVLFLAGYGLIAVLIYSGYYFLTMMLLRKWFNPAKWNLVKEIITLLPVLFLMSTASLYYHHAIIGGYTIRMSDVFYFFRISLAVAAIPFSVLLYVKWIRTKLISIEGEVDNKGYTINFESNNKKEKPVSISSSDLVYIKSNGNYIEIAVRENPKNHLIRNSLNQVESKLLDDDFLKIHRSYIVNAQMMESLIIQGSSYFVKIKDTDLKLPVSRSVVKKVREIIG